VMVEHGIHHIPVVDDDEELIGIITSSDMTGYLSTQP
jgi:CBS domain-containing protein